MMAVQGPTVQGRHMTVVQGPTAQDHHMMVVQDLMAQSKTSARVQDQAAHAQTAHAARQEGSAARDQVIGAAREAPQAWAEARQQAGHQGPVDLVHPVARQAVQTLKKPTLQRMKERPNGAKTSKPAQPKKIKKIQTAKKTAKD